MVLPFRNQKYRQQLLTRGLPFSTLLWAHLCDAHLYTGSVETSDGGGVCRNGRNPAWPVRASLLYIQVGKGSNRDSLLRWTELLLLRPKKLHNLFFEDKSKMSSILPDEAVFADFRRQCLSTDNWVNKYDSNGMQVWVEVPTKKENRGPKIHKIKVSFIHLVHDCPQHPPKPAVICNAPFWCVSV